MKTTYPFNSSNGDRKYNADNIAEEKTIYFSDGVIVKGGNALTTELKVVSVSGMTVKLNYGIGIVRGRTIKIEDPDEGETNITLEEADLANPRIDRIILELNLTDAVRDIVIKSISGTPATPPEAPVLTRTSEIYQLSLAQIAIPANSASIGAITDERGDASVCGISNVIVGITPPTGNDAETVRLSNETADILGLMGDAATVDNALRGTLGLESYMAFVTNANIDAVEAAMGKNNEDYIKGLGKQLARYFWFKGISREEFPFKKTIGANTINDVATREVSEEIATNNITLEYMLSFSYPREKLKNVYPTPAKISSGLILSCDENVPFGNSVYAQTRSIVNTKKGACTLTTFAIGQGSATVTYLVNNLTPEYMTKVFSNAINLKSNDNITANFSAVSPDPGRGGVAFWGAIFEPPEQLAYVPVAGDVPFFVSNGGLTCPFKGSFHLKMLGRSNFNGGDYTFRVVRVDGTIEIISTFYNNGGYSNISAISNVPKELMQGDRVELSGPSAGYVVYLLADKRYEF